MIWAASSSESGRITRGSTTSSSIPPASDRRGREHRVDDADLGRLAVSGDAMVVLILAWLVLRRVLR